MSINSRPFTSFKDALSSFTEAVSEVLMPHFTVEETGFRESMSDCSN